MGLCGFLLPCYLQHVALYRQFSLQILNDSFTSGAEFIFTIMVIYYLVEEIMEIKANKLEYFMSFWNCLDIFVILVIFLVFNFVAFI